MRFHLMSHICVTVLFSAMLGLNIVPSTRQVFDVPVPSTVVFYDELAFGWPKKVLLRMKPCGKPKALPDWHFLSGPGIYIDLGLLFAVPLIGFYVCENRLRRRSSQPPLPFPHCSGQAWVMFALTLGFLLFLNLACYDARTVYDNPQVPFFGSAEIRSYGWPLMAAEMTIDSYYHRAFTETTWRDLGLLINFSVALVVPLAVLILAERGKRRLAM